MNTILGYLLDLYIHLPYLCSNVHDLWRKLTVAGIFQGEATSFSLLDKATTSCSLLDQTTQTCSLLGQITDGRTLQLGREGGASSRIVLLFTLLITYTSHPSNLGSYTGSQSCGNIDQDEPQKFLDKEPACLAVSPAPKIWDREVKKSKPKV